MVIDLAMQIKDEIKHLITKNAELQERLDELTAERDELEAFAKRIETASRDKLGVTLFGVNYVTEEFMLHVQDELIAELTAERDELQAAIDAMGNGQMYAMYAAMRIERNDLRAEVDELNKHNANQADTTRRLRAQIEAALDDLVRAVEDKRSHPF